MRLGRGKDQNALAFVRATGNCNMLNELKLTQGASRNALHHAQPLNGVADGRLLVSVTEAMRSLTVGRTKLYELISANEIEIVKIGTATRVVVASIARFVERLRARASGTAA